MKDELQGQDGVTRRSILRGLGGAAALLLIGSRRLLRAQETAPVLRVTVHGDEVLARVPADFLGLSYEAAQLTHPDFFSGTNTRLVALVQTLSTHGVLRIGGNTSAFTRWDASGTGGHGGSSTGSMDAAGYGPDRGVGASKQVSGMYAITPRAIEQLRTFLDATGWGLIYGLNLRNGTPDAAAEEAGYVARVCGPRLVALQLGNEPDLFRHDDGRGDGKGSFWTYPEFLQKWKAMYAAVHARVPQAAIFGPDSAFKADYGARFASDAKGEFQAITTHYYAEGPPTDPKMTIDYLLHPGERLQQELYAAMDAAKAAGLPYRMSEGNSCYNGGKPGVSDTFASALWAGDFLLDLAARGAQGVYLHGGGNGVYTPIAAGQDGVASARPDFYGMWLAAQFAGSEMVRVELALAGGMSLEQANVTAYAAKKGKATLLAVFNKGQGDVTLAAAPMHGGGMSVLHGPALDSTTGVAFGQESREPGRVWQLQPDAKASAAPVVRAGSAVLLRMS